MKRVHVTFSDGDRHIYKECDVKASEEFLEKQDDMDGHVIVTSEYFQQVERKAKTFDLIWQAIEFHNILHDQESFKEDK
uniref:Uncharacterized protein n=1 Tax=Staphylococcus phage Pel11 TaxID=3235046 RepID=A0AB39C7M3_9CAUD